MNSVRSRSAKALVHAFVAATASLLLASCSTSPDGQASFALSNPALVGDETQQTQDAAADPTAAGADDATAQTADGAAVGAEGVPANALPPKVAYLPAAKPGTPFPKDGLAASEATAPQQAEAAIEDAAAQTQPSVAKAPAPAAPMSDRAASAAPAPAAKQQVLTAAPAAEPEFIMTATDPAAAQATPPKKRGLFASLFGANQASAAPAKAQKPLIESKAAAAQPKQQAEATDEAPQALVEEDKPQTPLVKLASIEPTEQLAISRSSTGSYGSDALPGVRKTALFEIKRKSGLDDESDVDLHEEDEAGPIRVASAAGMARLAPNGLLKQTERVDVGCLKPGLVKALRQLERHFGRKVVVTSGYRSPSYNRRVRGAKNSQHMYCAAADIQIAGVGKWELAAYARTLPGRGGVGTYCHTESVHIDIGPERDWNWRCRRRKA